MALSTMDKHIFADSLALQPQVIQSSVKGLVTPTAITTTAKPLNRQQLEKAIEMYGPILYLHPDERYFNTSIEDFLQHCTLVDKKTKTKVKNPSPDSLPQKGDDAQYYLDLESAGKKGDFSTTKAYVRGFWQSGMPHTDVQFWFFNAYNGPGSLHINGLMMDSISSSGDINVAPLGEHVGDWEMCMVRVDNTTLKIIAIWLSQHSKGQFFSRDQIDHAFTFKGTQPIIYSSQNGHANFSRPGSNASEYRRIGGIPAGIELFVRNDTAASKFKLDCSEKYELVSADWLNLPTPKWVTYPFRWGPEGTLTRLNPVTVAEIIKAAAGADLAEFLPVSALTVLAGEILPHFIKGNINGPTSPSRHGSWVGIYPVY
ncbi:uncharacterized protein Z518_03486 [Rhinocladiella mackenziei CBS 650.93]|uniref:Uncharacterized protein n=1 Tax=Rhinocladiella mackenziei CBS 650.93 TaxID=1442369 RepID=A0A0D2IS49_9EURO|nr:uncharacterized protein Z518_03486 [Rhinocladiella mackenziei CBS 650.93]KIX08829.1 hypothetical protein Z518_03486 [Rhinocladiella mackenziei CBS 650.93]